MDAKVQREIVGDPIKGELCIKESSMTQLKRLEGYKKIGELTARFFIDEKTGDANTMIDRFLPMDDFTTKFAIEDGAVVWKEYDCGEAIPEDKLDPVTTERAEACEAMKLFGSFTCDWYINDSEHSAFDYTALQRAEGFDVDFKFEDGMIVWLQHLNGTPIPVEEQKVWNAFGEGDQS